MHFRQGLNMGGVSFNSAQNTHVGITSFENWPGAFFRLALPILAPEGGRTQETLGFRSPVPR